MKRLGRAAEDCAAALKANVSSHGRAIDAPMPRRTVRRCMVRMITLLADADGSRPNARNGRLERIGRELVEI